MRLAPPPAHPGLASRANQLERLVESCSSGTRVLRATLRRVSDEYETSMSVPLDTEGFLRRECPTCEREFKWLPSQQDSDAEDREATPMPEGGYFCPYCAVQARGDAWFTKAQLDVAQAI